MSLPPPSKKKKQVKSIKTSTPVHSWSLILFWLSSSILWGKRRKISSFLLFYRHPPLTPCRCFFTRASCTYFQNSFTKNSLPKEKHADWLSYLRRTVQVKILGWGIRYWSGHKSRWRYTRRFAMMIFKHNTALGHWCDIVSTLQRFELARVTSPLDSWKKLISQLGKWININ